MTFSPPRFSRDRKQSSGRPLRIGLFGLLGSGNIGNDGSLEAVLRFLRAQYPEARLECLCPGPDEVATRYGIAARRLNWYRKEYQTASSPAALATKALAKIVDTFRIMFWVRRFDVILVPGSGILESALTVRPWDRPYTLFLVCAWGKLLGTKVALVGVGASTCAEPVTRRLLTAAARFAHYRSFRDELSRDALRKMGVRTASDSVYADVAFALPTPDVEPESARTVGVGVMAYHGGNRDRARAAEIYSTYVNKMTIFVHWLLDNDHRVVLFTGDQADHSVANEIVSSISATRPGADPSCVVPAPARSLIEVMDHMSAVETVVATRYHNVLCALKLGKPTVSIGYAAKNDALMAEMGLGEFCQNVRDLDIPLLIKQFTELEQRGDELRRWLATSNRAAVTRINRQFAVLADDVLPDRHTVEQVR